MKDGIGEGYTRADHQDVANQLFSCYAKVGDARSLASVIGEDELSPIDKKYLIFGNAFEKEFIGQGMDENRSMEDTLNKAWDLLGLLPREELNACGYKNTRPVLSSHRNRSGSAGKSGSGRDVIACSSSVLPDCCNL